MKREMREKKSSDPLQIALERVRELLEEDDDDQLGDH